jgi:5-methylcytosine-specific restriction protein A
MMPTDPHSLAELISAEIGLEFVAKNGADPSGGRWIDLWPAGLPASQTFSLRVLVGWRRIDVTFQPGKFSAHLMEAMGSADETGRRTFCAVLSACREQGADIMFSVNGVGRDPEDASGWSIPWRSLGLEIRRGMLSLNEDDAEYDRRQIEHWTSRAAAAVAALLPLEEVSAESAEASGLPEGAKTRIEVNRYERDRRNRAAALAIHGYVCKACDLDMSTRYGPIAAGMIEVHHVTLVSEMGPGHIVNPRTDLVPLCPNCHSVAHRRSPPFSITEVRDLLKRA